MEPADFARLHNTKGGVSDTELNEFAVRPTRVPAALRAVTIVTPVANIPNAWRNSAGEKLGAVARAEVSISGMTAILTDIAASESRRRTSPG